MRIPLDECVNRRLKAAFTLGDVLHVSDVGLDTLMNGALLRAANEAFLSMVTIDKNMPHWSSLKGLRLAVVVLDARKDGLPELIRFVSGIEALLGSLHPGTFAFVPRPS